ncbi:MgtC/SapB family protein [Sphingobacterium sp. Mn56C]|uniref:MgtC/SapB family protein n=1 Tax=Sphingobacterium sp. Mn56C TaxID=3395261 RepID=UPI003BD401F0
MTTLDFTLRLLVALLLGGCVGFERQWRQKSAGLRTNTLVCIGSAAFMLLSIRIAGDATGRIASYIVSGIGFLGAGVIMKDGPSVKGLNTAATIWCSAAVGALSGMGLFQEAFILTGFITFTHFILRPLGTYIHQQTFDKTNAATDYRLVLVCKIEVENHIRVSLLHMLEVEDKILLQSLASDDNLDKTQVTISALIKSVSPQDSLIERIASRLTLDENVTKVSWEIVATQSEM